ncbi:hypothetical protein OBBRIDRAFT_230410 [Obba rivulosa]|uniref:Uncharacterized protein n=1 Tax=Obba rivulosa TaxID=1052685 RepID=A0A8E2J872_9APHY|nr:hypothetical protein OBBRIDRAFT_230410 [Obba rivulosa]
MKWAWHNDNIDPPDANVLSNIAFAAVPFPNLRRLSITHSASHVPVGYWEWVETIVPINVVALTVNVLHAPGFDLFGAMRVHASGSEPHDLSGPKLWWMCNLDQLEIVNLGIERPNWFKEEGYRNVLNNIIRCLKDRSEQGSRVTSLWLHRKAEEPPERDWVPQLLQQLREHKPVNVVNTRTWDASGGYDDEQVRLVEDEPFLVDPPGDTGIDDMASDAI